MPVLRPVAGPVDPLALHRLNPARYPFLLESVAHGNGTTARYSLVLGFPGEQLVAAPGRDFLAELDHRWAAEAAGRQRSELPFSGGWFVYLGYEVAGEVEPRLRPREHDWPLPSAFAVRIPAAVIIDQLQDKAWMVVEDGAPDATLDQLQADLAAVAGQAVVPRPGAAARRVEEDRPEQFLGAVVRAKEYIREGDVFQANLSRAWRGELADGVDASELYARLRRANPAPFAGLAQWHGLSVVSSSPERLVRVRDGVVDTRPIAGTRPRSDALDEDTAHWQELMAHPKERAEHVMLIDLERNDLGRVSLPGSVRVDELMVLESYAHVHHIVSNVRGDLVPGTTPGQVIRAVFPGGTITGCPKVRCMEIIAELEDAGRGPYTGSMGYLDHSGEMDLNILIRTVLTDGERFELRAGAGIVADSQPEGELAETRAKARGLLLALGVG